MNIPVTQQINDYSAVQNKFWNQKVTQATNLVLHVSMMMVVTLLQNNCKKNYLRNDIREAMIYLLMLTVSDESKYITQTQTFLQIVH